MNMLRSGSHIDATRGAEFGRERLGRRDGILEHALDVREVRGQLGIAVLALHHPEVEQGTDQHLLQMIVDQAGDPRAFALFGLDDRAGHGVQLGGAFLQLGGTALYFAFQFPLDFVQCLFRLLAPRDVAGQGVHEFPLIGSDPPLQPMIATIPAAAAIDEVKDAAAGPEFGHRLAGGLAVVRMNENQEIPVEQLFLGVAEQALERRIDPDEAAVHRGQPHDVLGQIEKPFQVLVEQLQLHLMGLQNVKKPGRFRLVRRNIRDVSLWLHGSIM